jgi:serine protease Do
MKYLPNGKIFAYALLGIGLLAGGAAIAQSSNGDVPQVVRLTADGSYLGIEMEDITADSVAKYKLIDETGVIVRSVVKGSPAETAQLKENDVILEYAGFPVFSTSQLSRLVAETPVGRNVKLTVSRDGKKMSLVIKTAERRGFRSSFNLDVIPRTLERQFDVLRPGSGTWQFTVPKDRGLAFSVVPRSGRRDLGATVQTLSDQMADFLAVPGKKGVLVTSVTAGSPAASKLMAGDVITAIDGNTVSSPSELIRAFAAKESGTVAEFRVVRQKKEISVSVEIPKSSPTRRGIRA